MKRKTVYTIKEIAEELGFSIETIRRVIRSGALKAGKIDRDYRVTPEQLQEFWTARGGGPLFPEDVETQFNRVCSDQGKNPDTVMKHLMADFIRQARTTGGKEGQEEPTEGIQEAVKRRQQQAKVIL